MSKPNSSMPKALARFWSKVQESESGCWEWTGCKTGFKAQYGSFTPFGTKAGYAHRFSYEYHFGAIPEGMFVCHSCDNPGCVRPDHLFLGTPKDNTQDAKAKGRLSTGVSSHNFQRATVKVMSEWYEPTDIKTRGEGNGLAKLTEQDVREIRKLASDKVMTLTDMAKHYGTCRSNIRQIITGKTWRHVN